MEAVFGAGDTQSSPFFPYGSCLEGLLTDADLVAADLTFEITDDDGDTWFPVKKDDGTDYKVVADQSEFYLLNRDAMHSLRSVVKMRLVSSLAQAAGSTVKVFTR